MWDLMPIPLCVCSALAYHAALLNFIAAELPWLQQRWHVPALSNVHNQMYPCLATTVLYSVRQQVIDFKCRTLS